MSDEKSFKYIKRVLPLFRVVVKFCSTNRLFTKFFVWLICLLSFFLHLSHKAQSILILEFQTRYPNGKKTILYKKAKLEKFADYLNRDGLVTRLSIYTDSESNLI